MTDIKSAREIAEEKLARLGEATEEERLEWKYVPAGRELAVRYLKGDANLLAEVSRYSERERPVVTRAAVEVLARNIDLPRHEAARNTTRRAMEGIKLLKQDKASVENVFSRLRQIMNHYSQQGEQQRRQAREQLKAQFEERVRQAMQQQLGMVANRMRVDVERLPQFQEEWRRLERQLEAPYNGHLEEIRRELQSIP
mgnify:CR=1 FL=1